MITYVVAEIAVEDADGYESYKQMASDTITAHGGRYVARGGTADSLEGNPCGPRVVIVEFPDLEAARGWYHSDEYQAAAKVRQANATSRMFLVEGCVTPGAR